MARKGQKKKKQNKSGGVQSRPQGPPADATLYTGPCIGVCRRSDEILTCMEFRYITGLTTGGVVTILNPVFSNDCTGAAEWSSVSALWDSYRVLAMEIAFFPAAYTGTAMTGASMMCVMDYEDNTALASQTAALQYDSVQFRTIGTSTNPAEVGWRYGIWRASGSGLMKWNSMGSAPSSLGSIKCRADSLTASTGYGAIVLYWLVQLRGRQ